MRATIKETDLGEAAAAFWDERGFTNYHEVQCMGARADLVSLLSLGRVTLCVITECKTSLSLDVIGQAEQWVRSGVAHRVYVCVPRRRNGTHSVGLRVCEMLGVGVLAVDPANVAMTGHVCERLGARLVRTRSTAMIQSCTEAHRVGLRAGSPGGGYETPFRQTCRNVLAFVRRNPGASLKELVAGVSHHYRSESTAKQCLVTWIQAGKVPGVEARRNGNKFEFYAAAARATPTDDGAPHV